MSFSLRPRRLRALQVEVTSRCTRSCAVCPRTVLAPIWRDGDLGELVWSRLKPSLNLCRHVHLQGWGEPLLEPRLPDRVRDAKNAGCRVGITTNGERLEEAAEWIVSLGLDQVAVSVAGASPGRGVVRDHPSLRALWRGVAELATRRRRRRRPKISVGYLLTHANATDLTVATRAAAEAGADEVFVTHVDCQVTRALAGMAAFDEKGLRGGVQEAVLEAGRVAGELGLAFRPPPSAPEDLLVCALDPRRFAFVGWDGRVGPCVNLLLPVAGEIPFWFRSASVSVAPVVFGDLRRESLDAILDGEPRRRFLAPWRARMAAEQAFCADLLGEWGPSAARRLEQLDERRTAELERHPFPAPCAGCPKRLGW